MSYRCAVRPLLSWPIHSTFLHQVHHLPASPPPTMVPLSAISGSSKDSEAAIFDAIEGQFRLDDPTLHAIVNQFIEDFRLGLGQYGHPMAMMCVAAPICGSCTHFVSAPRS